MTNRKGDWMQTATGRQFWPIDPRPEDICLEDIAHALSNMCRYGGHCLRFYSVAEHCVLMSRVVAPEFKLWALLHDASEAYIVDVPRPLKPFLKGYQDHESEVMAAVCEKFGLDHKMPSAVKHADEAILADEMVQNMAPPPAPWNLRAHALGVRLEYWTPAEARIHFIQAVQAAEVAQAKLPASDPLDSVTAVSPEPLPFSAIDRVLNLVEVMQIVGIGRTSIYAEVKAGTFPKQRKLSPRRVGWLASDIDAWMKSRTQKRLDDES